MKRRTQIGARLGKKRATGKSPYKKYKKVAYRYPFATGKEAMKGKLTTSEQ